MELKIKKITKKEIPEIIELFLLVWNQNKKSVRAKTNWAFSSDVKAKVLVMKNENEAIISVRGGMQWPLEINNTKIKTYQLHGTCVHPEYRRQGIFSKINKAFVKQVTEENFQLIFNVSVKASKLGYEKLGWKYLDGFRRLTKLNNKRNIFKVKVLKKNNTVFNSNIRTTDIKIKKEFLDAREEQFKSYIHTVYDENFFNWRLSNKVENYQLYKTPKCVIVYKIKIVNNLKELIIGEVFLLEQKYTYFKQAVKKLNKLEKQDLTYTYIFNSHPYYSYFLRLFFAPNPLNYNLNFGTRVLGTSNQNLLNDKKWGVSFLDIDTF